MNDAHPECRRLIRIDPQLLAVGRRFIETKLGFRPISLTSRIRGMDIETILPALAAACLALLLWLAIRIMNRRERWAKWTAAAVIGVPVAYVLSFGPACWIASRTKAETLPGVYLPVLYAVVASENETILDLTRWYAGIGMTRTGAVNFPLVDENDEIGYCICNSDSEFGAVSLYRVEGRWSLIGWLAESNGRTMRRVPAPSAGGSRGPK